MYTVLSFAPALGINVRRPLMYSTCLAFLALSWKRGVPVLSSLLQMLSEPDHNSTTTSAISARRAHADNAPRRRPPTLVQGHDAQPVSSSAIEGLLCDEAGTVGLVEDIEVEDGKVRTWRSRLMGCVGGTR